MPEILRKKWTRKLISCMWEVVFQGLPSENFRQPHEKGSHPITCKLEICVPPSGLQMTSPGIHACLSQWIGTLQASQCPAVSTMRCSINIFLIGIFNYTERFSYSGITIKKLFRRFSSKLVLNG